MRRILLVLSVTVGMWGCSRSALVRELDASVGPVSRAEECNGRDDNQDERVDEPYRDALGRYLNDAHCGQCGNACAALGNVLEASCQLVDETPTCVAKRCAAGFGPARAGGCIPIEARLCLECADDRDCGALAGAACVEIAGELRCTTPCSLGCPEGYACDTARDACVPNGGSCRCEPGQDFELACPIDNNKTRLPGEPVCVGRSRCTNGVQSECAASVEVCDEVDNNCDGEIDEGFRDESGSYSISAAHCGRCGTSCLENTGTELELLCGGDPFAPACALACPDAKNGIASGDKLDGDYDINNGCECTVRNVVDLPGPVGALADALDENCDGADGVVREGVYVAADGNDTWPGSPTRPMRTISAAIAKASASLGTRAQRPNVYVASGSYTESLVLVDGVRVLGGYRRDFRALNPDAFLVEVLAPLNSTAPGGAALVARGVGTKTTEVAWLSVRGLDTTGAQALALGAFVDEPGPKFALRGVEIRAGRPGEGLSGTDGSAGDGPGSDALVGQNPHGALENASHVCVASAASRSSGGAGGVGVCNGINVSGGAGGVAACPVSAMSQGPGSSGVGPSPGAGGLGGQDAKGPIFRGTACNQDVCCGLSDFSVPTDFRGPTPGGNGTDGGFGTAGAGCSSPIGQIANASWVGAKGTSGTDGQPGSGGGGGGAGGGAEIEFVANSCAFVDGIGGGGGGGGAGGCGGRGGSAGTSGAPSVALLVIGATSLTLEDVTLVPANGADGGPGGAGGDGALGGAGAPGGSLAASARTTPTLAGTFAGARGGKGGQGGAGGGGGGGCGGSSVGIWLLGGSLDAATVRAGNTFNLGQGGRGGPGGGGARPGGAGAQGEAFDVVVQR